MSKKIDLRPRNQGQWVKYVKEIIKKINTDLEEYQFSIGCTYCDCENKMFKLQKKWEEYNL